MAQPTLSSGPIANQISMSRERSKIKNQLKQGDIERIAEITGLTADYISKIMRGERESEFVLMIAKKYLQQRKDLTREAARLQELKTLPEKY